MALACAYTEPLLHQAIHAAPRWVFSPRRKWKTTLGEPRSFSCLERPQWCGACPTPDRSWLRTIYPCRSKARSLSVLVVVAIFLKQNYWQQAGGYKLKIRHQMLGSLKRIWNYLQFGDFLKLAGFFLKATDNLSDGQATWMCLPIHHRCCPTEQMRWASMPSQHLAESRRHPYDHHR